MTERARTRTIDSLDAVEFLMALEEVFEVPEEEIRDISRDREEFVDLIYAKVSNSRPSRMAVAMLRTLAEKRKRPNLVDQGCWTREQVEAVLDQLFTKL